MTTPKRDLFLIVCNSQFDKSTLGKTLVQDFDFLHYDLENPETVDQCASNPEQFIDELLKTERSVVVTWGFVAQRCSAKLVRHE